MAYQRTGQPERRRADYLCHRGHSWVSGALDRLLAKIAPRPEDEVVFVGGYIDRGSQSREVVERLLGLPYWKKG